MIFPIKLLNVDTRVAQQVNVDLSKGFIFRSHDKRSKHITDQPVTSFCMTERLKIHLTAIKVIGSTIFVFNIKIGKTVN